MKMSRSPIQDFFFGTTVLITGATGFIGKCLLEKLLRTCPDIDKIYIVVRERRGKDVASRVEELFQDIVFSKLKEQSDKYQTKVVAIPGDVASPELGLSPQDRLLLKKEVNVVFHVAATVNFNEKLRVAVATNVNGTNEILELSKEMEQLKSIVHVSTAYSNCNLGKIDEIFYNCPITYKDITSILSKLDDDAVDELTPKMLADWPNTYTFTKAIAEDLVHESMSVLPLAMFRPAVVVATWREPLEGWIDNVYGPTGICAGALMGILSSMWCDGKAHANIVPVDMTINALIACAWETSVRYSTNLNVGVKNEITLKDGNDNMVETADQINKKHIHANELYEPMQMYTPEDSSPSSTTSSSVTGIFNFVSSVEKPLTWSEYCGINMMYGQKYPLKDAIWKVNFEITKYFALHTMYMVFFHYVPAIFFDSAAVLFGQKPRLLKIYKQTGKFVDVMSYFSNKDWEFSNNNVQQLWRILDPKDKQLFPFSMADMNWLDYFRVYILGMRKYLCKEDESTIPDAIRKQTRLKIASTCLKMILYYISIHTLVCTFKMIL